LDFFGLFPSFYGYFKKDHTRKRFPIFRSVTNIIYERSYNNITLNFFNVNKIELKKYLENNESYDNFYFFIPKYVKYLDLFYREITDIELFKPYFSRFKDLVSLKEFIGTNLQINKLIEILQKHSPDLRELGLSYEPDNYRQINIFEKQIDKLEHLNVYINQNSLIPPSIKFNINMIKNLKTFGFSITSNEMNIKFVLSSGIISELENCEHLLLGDFIIFPTHVYEINELIKLNKLTLEECDLFTKKYETTFDLLFQSPNIKYLNIIDYSIEINMNQLKIINDIKILSKNLKEIYMYDLRNVATDVHYYEPNHINHSQEGKEIIDKFIKKIKDKKIKLTYLPRPTMIFLEL
jgi:hypothetical protein